MLYFLKNNNEVNAAILSPRNVMFWTALCIAWRILRILEFRLFMFSLDFFYCVHNSLFNSLQQITPPKSRNK